MAHIFPNRLLKALETPGGIDLASRLEPVPLPVHQVLFDFGKVPRYVHFLTSGIASVTTVLKSGSMIEVGLYGYEGFPKAVQLLGPQVGSIRCFMQVAGTGLRMPLRELQQLFEQNAVLRDLVLRLVQYENLSLSQFAACNGFHEAEQRLARWLLMVADRIHENDLPLTQEFLSEMLGARRATVTLAAGQLQRSGLIEYRRGAIHILNRKGLEQAACECYEVSRKLLEDLYR